MVTLRSTGNRWIQQLLSFNDQTEVDRCPESGPADTIRCHLKWLIAKRGWKQKLFSLSSCASHFLRFRSLTQQLILLIVLTVTYVMNRNIDCRTLFGDVKCKVVWTPRLKHKAIHKGLKMVCKPSRQTRRMNLLTSQPTALWWKLGHHESHDMLLWYD